MGSTRVLLCAFLEGVFMGFIEGSVNPNLLMKGAPILVVEATREEPLITMDPLKEPLL